MKKILYLAQEHGGATKCGGFGDASVAMGDGMKDLETVDFSYILPGTDSFLKHIEFDEATRQDIADYKKKPIGIQSFEGKTNSGIKAHVVLSESIMACQGNVYNSVDGICSPNGYKISHSMAQVAVSLAEQDVQTPTVLHLNGPFYADAAPLIKERGMTHVRTVTNIHLLKDIDGVYGSHANECLPLSARQDEPEVSFWATGFQYSDHIIAVSPQYAIDVQSGFLTSALLRTRAQEGALTGIINGINADLWSPQKCFDGSWIEYDEGSLDFKKQNKAMLLQSYNMEGAEDRPLISFIHRLDPDQKGCDVFASAIPVLTEQGAIVIVHGQGDSRVEHQLRELAQENSNVILEIGHYEDTTAQRIWAASDIHVTSSINEPCSYSNLYAMAFGNIPVVTPTGGLMNAVTDMHANPENGNGFISKDFGADNLIKNVLDAVNIYQNKPEEFRQAQQRAMQAVPSHVEMAKNYLQVYDKMFSMAENVIRPVKAQKPAIF